MIITFTNLTKFYQKLTFLCKMSLVITFLTIYNSFTYVKPNFCSFSFCSNFFFIIRLIKFITIGILMMSHHISSPYWHFFFYGYCRFCHFNQSSLWRTNNCHLHLSSQTFSKFFLKMDITRLLGIYCT